MVPSDRMQTVYDFTVGAIAGTGAKQVNMILVHPTAVIAQVKRSSIYRWAPGTHIEGDGWLYQNRSYADLIIIKNKIQGVQISAAR